MLNFNNNLHDRLLNKNLASAWFTVLVLLILFCCTIVPNTPQAQTPSFSGTSFLNNLATGDTTFNSAVQSLSQQSGLSNNGAQNILQSIVNNPELPLDAGGEILEGFVNNALSAGDIGNITSLIDNVRNIAGNPEAIRNLVTETVQGNLPPALSEAISLVNSPEAIENLVRETITGNLPPQLTQALTTIENLGDLVNADNIGDVFSNPLVADALQELQIGGMSADQLATQIQTIAGIVSDPQAFIQENIEQITEQILNNIQSALPEVFNSLSDAFGAENLGELVSGLLGSATSSPTTGSNSGGGGSGTNTLQDADPGMCSPDCGSSCGNCAPAIHNNHVTIRDHTSAEFSYYQQWMITTFFIENIAKSLMGMTNELVTNAMQQVQIIGTFFDAKHQLESQRLQQTLTAKAHKDYHPSESLCIVGTNTRSFAGSKRNADLTKNIVATRLMDRQLNKKSGISQEGFNSDTRSRIDLFIEKFCNKTDGGADGSGEFGLGLLCKNSTPRADQINADVNYTATIENNLTLNTNFTSPNPTAPDVENVLALGANLFAHQTLPIITQEEFKDNPDLLNYYIDLRSMAAKRSVAQNSFAAITGMRTNGDGASAPFLKALLTDSGLTDQDAQEMIGDKPSYFAQEEIMTKALYQNPSFYSNLYDKPANVERMGAALLAMEIIQDRNIYESLLRSEAVLSTLVETLLLKEQRRVSGDIDGLKLTGRKRGN